MEGKFKGQLFGFKKQDVYDYIKKLSEEFERALKSKDEQINNLKSKCEELKNQLEMVMEKNNELQKEKDYISGAIIKAENEARRIIENATQSALDEQRKIKLEIEKEKSDLQRIKEEIINLKKSAVESVKRYERELSAIVAREEETVE